MSTDLKQRLASLGIELPRPVSPSASYLPWSIVDGLLFISGQVPKDAAGNDCFIGKVGQELGLNDGRMAAQMCAVNVLAQVNEALDGDLTRLKKCVRISGYVNSVSTFNEHPQVINGASDLLTAVLGENGRHTRTAIGVAGLPRNVAVEIDAIFSIEAGI